eukprot:scaffold4897_cov110-Alexandrium_tamarense.AAC.1
MPRPTSLPPSMYHSSEYEYPPHEYQERMRYPPLQPPSSRMTAPPPRHHPYYENYQLVRNNRSAEYDYYDTHGEPMSTMTMHPQHQLPITP